MKQQIIRRYIKYLRGEIFFDLRNLTLGVITLSLLFRKTDKAHSLQPDMRFSSNSSYVNRIIDGLAKNRVTDFEFEGASPMLRRTINGATTMFNASFKGKEGRNLTQSFKTIS